MSAEPRTEAPAFRVANISAGDAIAAVLLMTSLEQRTKKNGEPYFFMKLRDSSGEIHCVMWDNHDTLAAGTIQPDDFVFVEGHCSEFNNSLQLTVRSVRRVDDEEVNLQDFLAFSPRPRDEMEAELDALIESVENTDCRRLLERLFSHERFRDLYCTAPAAAKIHQAYIGGLLEHTLAVIRNALHFATYYGPCDRDVLVTAGILHDVGKIREYNWRRSISYSDEGRLIGHISIGAAMVENAIRALQREEGGFSDDTRQHLLHLILSHHGKMEYGSPVIPKTKEALFLHYADYTEAYLSSFNEMVPEFQNRGQQWTSFSQMFGAFMKVPPATPGADAPGANAVGDAALDMEGRINAGGGGPLDDASS